MLYTVYVTVTGLAFARYNDSVTVNAFSYDDAKAKAMGQLRRKWVGASIRIDDVASEIDQLG